MQLIDTKELYRRRDSKGVSNPRSSSNANSNLSILQKQMNLRSNSLSISPSKQTLLYEIVGAKQRMEQIKKNSEHINKIIREKKFYLQYQANLKQNVGKQSENFISLVGGQFISEYDLYEDPVDMIKRLKQQERQRADLQKNYMITRFNAEKFEDIQKQIAVAITDLDTSIKAKGFGIHKSSEQTHREDKEMMKTPENENEFPQQYNSYDSKIEKTISPPKSKVKLTQIKTKQGKQKSGSKLPSIENSQRKQSNQILKDNESLGSFEASFKKKKGDRRIFEGIDQIPILERIDSKQSKRTQARIKSNKKKSPPNHQIQIKKKLPFPDPLPKVYHLDQYVINEESFYNQASRNIFSLLDPKSTQTRSPFQRQNLFNSRSYTVKKSKINLNKNSYEKYGVPAIQKSISIKKLVRPGSESTTRMAAESRKSASSYSDKQRTAPDKWVSDKKQFEIEMIDDSLQKNDSIQNLSVSPGFLHNQNSQIDFAIIPKNFRETTLLLSQAQTVLTTERKYNQANFDQYLINVSTFRPKMKEFKIEKGLTQRGFGDHYLQQTRSKLVSQSKIKDDFLKITDRKIDMGVTGFVTQENQNIGPNADLEYLGPFTPDSESRKDQYNDMISQMSGNSKVSKRSQMKKKAISTVSQFI